MLSISEICDKAGITLHAFQSWRRDGRKLLPKPVGVDKKVIYFDDSILERIRLIQEHKAAGRRLVEIDALFKSCEASAISSKEPDRKIAVLTDMLAQLALREATLQKLLADHKSQMREFFQNFQTLMAGEADGHPADNGEM